MLVLDHPNALRCFVTEAGWLTCTGPTPMLEFLRGKASDRKLRLFACACCRRVWHLLRDESSREAVRTAEAFAEGNATEADLRVAFDAVSGFVAGGLGGIADRAVRDAVGNTGWPGSPATAVRRAVGAAFHAAHAACGVTLERIRALPRGKRTEFPNPKAKKEGKSPALAVSRSASGSPSTSVPANLSQTMLPNRWAPAGIFP